MIKEIKYRGISEQPSDYECQDGELASVVGMVPEDGGLRAVQEPYKKFTLPDGYTVAFIHQNTGYKHYIIKYTVPTGGTDAGTVKLYWIDGSKTAYTTEDFIDTDDTTATPAVYSNLLMTLASGKELYEVNSTGNTLVVLTSDGMYYILWKGELDEHGYKMLGNHLPELPISFGLQGELSWTGDTYFEFGGHSVDVDHLYDTLSDAVQQAVTNGTLAKVNSFIADKTREGKFVFPFLVRYAYRLYDTSLTMHSAPILMVANSKESPQCFTLSWATGTNSVYGVRCAVASVVSQLDYLAHITSAQREIIEKEWADIIKSVDIFVSQPIYTYNQNGKCERFMQTSKAGLYSVCKLPQPLGTDPEPYYQDHLFSDAFSRYYTGEQPSSYYPSWIEIPSVSDDALAEAVSTSRFYLLKSIRITDLEISQRSIIDIDGNYLSSLVNREVMSDDYDSHDMLSPKRSFTYNQRLNIVGISKRLFDGYDILSAFSHTNSLVNSTVDIRHRFKLRICINQDGKEMIVEAESGLFHSLGLGNSVNLRQFQYIYYPNSHAYKAYLMEYYSGGTYIRSFEFNLYPHESLNGAYCFAGLNESVTPCDEADPLHPSDANIPVPTTNNLIDVPNSLYTSEVGNPYVFTPKGINTIGTGQIIGIRPAAKAMSPSQYGDYVFYVLSSDGVWVLKPSSEGYLEKPAFVTPDVVLGNGESITQVDSVVLFASARGVMLLDGSKCTCISDSLNSEQPFKPFVIPAEEPSGTVVDVLPGLSKVVSEEDVTTLQVVRFRDYLDGCRMLYDYVHQRVLLYNPEQPYAYVYSMKSKQWGMLPSTIQETLPSYPHAEAMIRATREEQQGEPATTVTVACNAVVDYSEDTAADGEQLNGLIITRPMKLDLADALKTVTSVIQRGMFRKGHVKTVLYASRDLVPDLEPDLEDGKSHWQLVWSSQDHYLRGFSGTPYKYFRLALLCELEKQESLDGCSVQYDIRLTDRLR